MADLVKVEAAQPGALAPALVDAARGYAEASRSSATCRAYRREWAAFVIWCATVGASPLPAGGVMVALYLTGLAERGRKPAGLDLALAAISEAHRAAGHPSPREAAEVRVVRRGIRRTKRIAQRQARPVLVPELRKMLAATPDSLRGLRDRALLLVGFTSAARRSELVGLNLGDVAFSDDGATLTLRHSKTDQEGRGRVVGLPFASASGTCPVRTLRAWIEAAVISEGPIFREVSKGDRVHGRGLTGDSVSRLVKRAAMAAGLDPTSFSGHSLRAGLATAAAKAGESERAIMAQTGHRSVQMVRRYIRDGELFSSENAAAGLL